MSHKRIFLVETIWKQSVTDYENLLFTQSFCATAGFYIICVFCILKELLHNSYNSPSLHFYMTDMSNSILLVFNLSLFFGLHQN